MIDGQVLRGHHGIAGEWGHTPLAWIGDQQPRMCWCGRRNCVESWLSGPALGRSFSIAGGEEITPAQGVHRAAQGDPVAQGVFETYCMMLARALAGIINVLDPEVIVLGGGLSNVNALYDAVPPLWRPHVFCDPEEPVTARLSGPRYGDSSGVRGAAWL